MVQISEHLSSNHFLPDPGNGVSWEGNKSGNRALFKASYDKTNNQQVTNTVKLNGASSVK